MADPQATATTSAANNEVVLDDQARDRLVETKVTCPFVGTAVAMKNLAVRNDADNPLASIEDVRRLGNSGGGSLGEVLVLFAQGNHAMMRDSSGKLTVPVPAGLFSLELPGSQGSHAGHSGILETDPKLPGSGKLNEAAFQRLVVRARDGRVKRSDVGRFIAENLIGDPGSQVGTNVADLLADLGEFVEGIGPALLVGLGGGEQAGLAHREMLERLTRMMGQDNLVGSAGEFGLLFAFLANKPGALPLDGEPALSVQDLHSMFVAKKFPNGWESWKKNATDWVVNTHGLARSAHEEYQRLKKRPG